MANKLSYTTQRWTDQFEQIDIEIGQLASVCQVRLLDPGVLKRVLHSDTGVCGHQNPRAFDKLRQLLLMHYSVRDRALIELGPADTLAILGDILERLRQRFGDALGGAPRST